MTSIERISDKSVRPAVEGVLYQNPESDYHRACELLSGADQESDPVQKIACEKEAFRALDNAKKGGYHDAIIDLALYYMIGRGGVKPNPMVAKQYMNEYLELAGSPRIDNIKYYEVMDDLALCRDNEVPKLLHDRIRSRLLRKKNPDLMSLNFGIDCWNKSRRSNDSDSEEWRNMALYHIKLAADNNYPRACRTYAGIVAMTSNDPSEIVYYLDKAQELGVLGIEVVRIVWQLNGILPSDKKSSELIGALEQIAEAGNDSAKKVLKQINEGLKLVHSS